MRRNRPCPRCRRLERDKQRLERKVRQLKQEVTRLRDLVHSARRAGKRQAAPFSKGPPKSKPRRPGRKAGANYGKKAWRPPPDRIDEVIEAELPERSPCCGAEVEPEEVREQFQTELPPVRPHVTQFNVHVGWCLCCGKRVQGHHPRQSSQALGAAASHLGPRVLALAAELNKGLGIPFGKVKAIFETAFGLTITRGGLCQALHRVAKRAEPTYEALKASVRHSPVVTPDETGWKVAGWTQWLWVFVTEETTVYAILEGRGFEQASSVLGEDYDGFIERDGWAPYRQFICAIHQTCLGHLLRRCHENLETAQRGTARLPLQVKAILQKALALRDRRDREQISAHGLLVATGRIEARMDRLLKWRPTDEENRKLVKHLNNERDALFTFLKAPGVEATNWRAEQAIRPAVVTRKVWGGNRTWRGAHTQEVLMSVLRTCRQRDVSFYPLIIELLQSPTPVAADLLCAAKQSPRQRAPPLLH